MSLNGVKTGVQNNNHITLIGKRVVESSQQSHSLTMVNIELSEKRLLRNEPKLKRVKNRSCTPTDLAVLRGGIEEVSNKHVENSIPLVHPTEVKFRGRLRRRISTQDMHQSVAFHIGKRDLIQGNGAKSTQEQ
ncbi:hypothetical protein L3X38_011935 [Prunus dulcis]|uniref:Uncharacterized protein n=1 Tax=Prunus dulcis TaxID=3755 RepID=A0AAD4WIB4_PRUDU|nr:hypothetical protein L3X38_011935 [Prunus dulcis]